MDSDKVGCQTRRAVVVVGRFNPPTVGHALAIKTAKRYAQRHSLDAVFVVVVAGVNTSKDLHRNPLSATRRILYMQASPDTCGVRYLYAPNAFVAFTSIRHAGYEPVAVVGGVLKDGESVKEDRANSFVKMLDDHFMDSRGEPYAHVAVSIPRNSESDAVDGVSGTKLRNAISEGDFESFSAMVMPMDDRLKQQLFAEIQDIWEPE